MRNATEIEAQIRSRVDEDKEFRARLLEDPRGTINDVTGLTVPEAFTIHIHEESATEFHLVLPQKSVRLSDDEMRGLAGGWADNTW